jgi:asparagine synthase (glutamine-hydrolysing)
MCGIVGIAGLADEKRVRLMADSIVHRGPDGEGYISSDGISLGARRLSIIDLHGSNQPIWNEDGTVVTVFNGEIYNYQELRSFLEKKGHILQTAGDTEVLVHLYEEYGEAGVHYLRGMFAYAIWDKRRRRLVLARDRLGIKPLYYAETGNRLLFASELKALLAGGNLPRELEDQALDLYLTLQYVPGPLTMLRGIRKLPPGHLLLWHDGRAIVQRYWDVVLQDDDWSVKEETAAEAFQELLEDSVRCHRIADVPVGVLLSGGMDSSAVTALLARTGERPQTFTVGFEAAHGISEIREARVVADHLGTNHREVIMTAPAVDLLPRLVWLQDEPVADVAALPTYFICQFASQFVKVVLTGEGGDELLGGYPRYWWLDIGERLRPLLSSPGLGALARSALRAAGFRSVAARHVGTLLSPVPLGERHLEWIANVDKVLKRELRSAGLGDGNAADGTSRVINDLVVGAGVRDPVSALMYVDFKTWLPDNLLTKMDRMSMAVSLEARVPLLDHRLIEFVAALPQRLKVRRLRTKGLLRQAMKQALPERTLRRSKQAFLVPIAAWLRSGLRDFMIDTLTASVARQRGLFRPETINRILREHVVGDRDHSQALWTMLWLELWLTSFVDAHPARHP